jgi:hypothetical protein
MAGKANLGNGAAILRVRSIRVPAAFAALLLADCSGVGTPGLIPADDPTANRMGINVGAPTYYDQGRMYADVMQTAYQLNAGSTDANGWPLSGSFSVNVWADMAEMNGTYTLYFKGQATGVSGGDGVTGLTYDAAANRSTAKVQMNNAGMSVMTLNFSGATRNDGTGRAGATQIQLMRPVSPGSTTSYAYGEMFHQPLKDLVARFQVVRFMDYLATNNNQQREWVDRVWPTEAFWARNAASPPYHDTSYASGNWGWQGRGGPWEHVILFANATGRDAWIDIPVGANDDYVAKVAQMFLYGSDGTNPYTSPQANPVYPPLNAGLRVYVEYSNEIWNGSGSFIVQQNMNRDRAVAEVAAGNSPLDYDHLGSGAQWQWAWRRIAKRGLEISKIFRNVFGDAAMMTRVRPVYMSQAMNASVGFEGLKLLQGYYNNGEGAYVTEPHPPSYYFYGAGGAGYYNPDNFSGSLTADGIWSSQSMSVANWSSTNPDIGGFAPGVWNVAAMGLRSVAYEGGPSFDNVGASEAVKSAAWSDPRMKDSVVAHHDAWSSFGGDLLTYYQATGDYQWGFVHSINSQTTPKVQAIDQLRTTPRAAVTLGYGIPATVDGAQHHVNSPGWGAPGAGSQPFTAGDPNATTVWASYSLHGSGPTATVTLAISQPSSGAQVAAYWDGVLLGTVPATATVSFGSVAVDPHRVHGLIVRATSGSFSLDSISVR